MMPRIDLDRSRTKLYSSIVQLMERWMAIYTTYSDARQHLADYWRRVEEDPETVIISRRGHDDVALVAADELAGLLETARLLRSPANTRRLLAAMNRALGDEGSASTLGDLRREFGLGAA